MRTAKWNPFLTSVCTLAGVLFVSSVAARADVTTTNAAAIVVYPKLVLDSRAFPSAFTDTIIQLTNTSPFPVTARCFYVNANAHCSNNPTEVCDAEDPLSCGSGARGACLPGWVETDFNITLTPKQPIAWLLSAGLPNPLAGGSIPPAPEDPFIGELKCIQTNFLEQPTDQNDLKGEATIETFGTPVGFDSRSYNAIGIKAVPGANDGNNTLLLGQEYNACPNVLIMDHFFDDARLSVSGASLPLPYVRSDLTLVPCSQDFNLQAPLDTIVQFLVFNEFEQRFSTSFTIRCFREVALSDIGGRKGGADDFASIFNVNVQGTLAGQTIIRAVGDGHTTHGHGLVGVLEEFHSASPGPVLPFAYASAAANLHQRGERQQLDVIQLPAVQTQQ